MLSTSEIPMYGKFSLVLAVQHYFSITNYKYSDFLVF